MNAADVRKLTEKAKSDRQARGEAVNAAADAQWLATGIANVEQDIQNAAKNECEFYEEICKTCPDFVVEHFKKLGFTVTVKNTRSVYGSFKLILDW